MFQKPLVLRPRNVEWYGWRPDRPDHRDYAFRPTVTALPSAVDLRRWCPPVMDQGNLGSCTAHGIIGAVRFVNIKQGKKDVPLSRLQLYYDERALEGSIRWDDGAEIRDGIKCVAKIGVGAEVQWPYIIKNFAKKPPTSCYKSAAAEKTLAYARVSITPTAIKQAIASGFPVVFGISVFESFESDAATRTGMIPMPGPGEYLLGGHCMYAVGYGQKPGHFTVRNSWATDWGDNGDCYLPEAYLGSPSYGSDYWVLTK